MQGLTSYILTCICVTICTHWVFAEDKPTNISEIPNITSFINMIQSVAEHQFFPNKIGQKTQEVCPNNSKKEMRYKNIIKLQENVNLKMKSQLLKQIQDCNQLRQRVRKLIAKYQRAKTALRTLKASNCTAKRTNVLDRKTTISL